MSAADLIYLNGDIVTVSESTPSAEAVAVRHGKILAVGSLEEVLQQKGPETKVVDLQGKTMVPGFVDAHSHFVNALQIVSWANVSAPPVGAVSNIAELLTTLEQHKQRLKTAPGDWVIGYGYDANTLSDGREMTAEDLDAISPENPVMVIHVSLHGAVLNSLALKHFNLTAATPTPPGGVIARKPGGNEPAGLIQEIAFLPIYAGMPKASPEELMGRMEEAQAIYARAGITTATEGATGASDMGLLQRAAAEGRFYVDVVSLVLVTELAEVLKTQPPDSFGSYQNRLKLHGVKTFADGSPMSRTAFFRDPYLLPGPAGETPWRGEPTFPLETFLGMFKTAYDKGLPLFIHANGDEALDMLLHAHEQAAGDDPCRPRGTTVIHGQFVRPDQLEKFVRYNINVSFYTEHTFFFADAHLTYLGPERTQSCSPMKTALAMGVRCSNHTDFCVLPIDQMFTIWTAVNRISRTGKVIGPEERVTPLQALRAITIEAAHHYGEESSKGSIEVGKLADLTVLSANPLKVDPLSIKDITIVGTIKEGKPIYSSAGAPWLEPAVG